MAWIGGIFSKVDTSQDELRGRLAVMVETACPANGPSAFAHPHCTCSVFDDVHGQALVQLSIAAEGTQSEDICMDCREKPVFIYDGHLYSLRDTASGLARFQHTVHQTIDQSLAHLLSQHSGNLEQKVKRALPSLDGDYALAVHDSEQIVVSRNHLGTKPLHFAENDELCAFASTKKPLWKIGMDEVRPLRAGAIAVFDNERVSVKKASPHRRIEIQIEDMAQAVDKYEQALHSAVRKRLAAMNHVRKVGVLLSGGVDSCLMAKLLHDAASALGMDVIAYTSGLPGSLDMSFARESVRELGVNHEVKILSIDAIEEYIPKVIEAVEDSDFVQVETGIGLYAATDMASQDGVRVVFSGQGPDELWGGYNWYPKVLGKDGRQELRRRMWEDFTRADIETLDRENKIAMAHGIELFFPYLDSEVVDVAMSVASELKVTSEEDHLGKHPHRQVAIRMGIPKRYANREKLAIQHGTGIHGILDDIARRNGFDPALVKDIGYSNEKITTAQMGSSSRYGYRYTEKKLWQVPQHIQFFLHALAYRRDLLDRSVRDRVAYFLEKATRCPEVSV